MIIMVFKFENQNYLLKISYNKLKEIQSKNLNHNNCRTKNFLQQSKYKDSVVDVLNNIAFQIYKKV